MPAIACSRRNGFAGMWVVSAIYAMWFDGLGIIHVMLAHSHEGGGLHRGLPRFVELLLAPSLVCVVS